MPKKPKKTAVLVGGPFDGVVLEPAPAGEVEEVILRTVAYFPGRPRDWVYRLDAGACLDVSRLLRGYEAGVRSVIYRHTGETALAQRVRAQDGELQLRSVEVNRLVGDVQWLQGAVRKKDEKCRKCKTRKKQTKGDA